MSKFLRDVTSADIDYVAAHMRQADENECKAVAGMHKKLALLLSCEIAEEKHTLVSPKGEPVGICGLAPGAGPDDKQVWMLGTTSLPRYKTLFLRESRVWFEEKASRYLLWNVVDARNTLHVKWLKWLGCNFHGQTESPYTRTPLLHFTKVTLCA
jgi:hypothetical protein